MYGGAAGGGKTDALLLCDLRWVDHPLHRSLYLRRTRPQLQEAIDRSLYLYPEIVPGANWQEGKSRWEMPSGAIFQFGYAEHEQDILNYKSFEYNVIKFDELTSFTEKMYLFMFMRNRTKAKELPLWIRSGTNPGDVGHEFVFNRFIDKKEPYKVYLNEIQLEDRIMAITQQFIPSTVWDNPALPNRDEYIAGLAQMSEEEVAAYLYGQWTKLAGAMFRTMPEELDAPGLSATDHYVIRCLDYGWQDHTAVYWLIVYNNGAFIDIAAELYMNQTPIDSIAHLILAKDNELQMLYGVRPVSYTIGSPEMNKIEGTSNQSLATIFASRGVMINPAKGTQSNRKTGWSQLQRFLVGKRLRAWPGACPNLLKTLPVLLRDPNKPDDLKPRQNDHCADAIRYGVMAIVDNLPTDEPMIDVRKDNPMYDQTFEKIKANLMKQNRNKGLGQFF